MARIETWFDQDLKKPVQVHKLEGIFNEDSQGNVIGVNLFDDGVALTSIAGSVTGYFLLADGTTTSAAGTKSGNKASVVVPPAAYKVPGPITITVRILNSSDITTVCACVGLVILSKTPVATPAGSTVADWSAQISAALQNCEDVVAQSVKYGSAQSLTDAQKAQARTNIGAASQTDMSAAQTVIGNTALPTTAQTLTGAVAEHESDLTNQQGQITDLKSAFDKLTGDYIISFASGYVKSDYTNSDVGTVISLTPTPHDSLSYAIVSVNEGDTVFINGKGSTVARLWMFVDEDDKFISNSAASLTGTDLKIIAPTNAAKCIINTFNVKIGVCCVGEPLVDIVEKVNDKTYTIEENLDNRTMSSSITCNKNKTGGYIPNTSPVNVLMPTTTGSYTGTFVWDRCNTGDKYIVNLSSLSGIYPWMLCDESGAIVEHGIASASETNKTIEVPAGCVWFGANCYGANDSVVKYECIPQTNKSIINKTEKDIPFKYIHKYLDTSSPIDITNPGIYSAFYQGGLIFESCSPGDVYVISAHLSITIGYVVTIYDSTGAIIDHSWASGNTYDIDVDNLTVIVPENGAYIAFQCNNTTSKVKKIVPLEDAIQSLQNEIEENVFSGKKGVAFGTSLTARADSAGTYGYLTQLREELDCTIDNQGVGGSYWFLVEYSDRSVTYVVENYANYADKDFVIIEGCVNDWFTSKGLGTYTDNVYTSVCGCLRKMIDHIYAQKPTAQIYVILDHQGRNYNGNDCSAPAVVNGKTQYEYYSELKKVCEMYSIPVICEFAESNIGMYGTQYLVDNIHCNELGAKQSGEYIARKMKQIGIKALN